MPTSTRQRRSQLLRVVGLVVLLGIVFARVDTDAVRASWRGMSALSAVAVLVAFNAAMALRIGKWAWQLRSLGLRYDRRALARNFLVAVVLGAVTPLRAGELYRLAAIQPTPDKRAEELALAAASLLLEKGYEVLGLVGIVLIGALTFDARIALLLAPIVAIGLAFGVGSLAPPAALVAMLPERLRTWAVVPLLRARDGLPVRARWGLLALTTGAHGLNLLGGLGVYRAFGPMPADTFLLRMPLVTLTNVLPISIGGIGVREMAAMEIFGQAGFPASSAAVAATCMFLGANLAPALTLLPWVWRGAAAASAREASEAPTGL